MTQRLFALFPRLAEQEFRVTSPATENYNCIAWAAGVNDSVWDPAAGYYWPANASRRLTVDAFVSVFKALGYEHCETPDPEPTFEKVAIFSGGVGWPTHVARQLANGSWTSKIGGLEDIEHAALDALSGTEYGAPVAFLKRPRLSSREA